MHFSKQRYYKTGLQGLKGCCKVDSRPGRTEYCFVLKKFKIVDFKSEPSPLHNLFGSINLFKYIKSCILY